MKKFLILIIMSICFLLTGCGSSNITISLPSEVIVGNQILIYNDENKNFDFKDFKIYNKPLKAAQDNKENSVVVNKDNKIRCISIVDKTIKTYNNISVGDSYDKIKKLYNNLFNMDNIYSVLFNDTMEDNLLNKEKNDNWIIINYILDDDNNICRILIYDVKYGRESR